ncbi:MULTISPECIES: hypothetical protein [Burkholderia]|uniref:DUF4376 domain-containing protein n=1 Tax=Burkholderia TaxID=32008 RepID=UPI000B7AEE0A|nr:MULTISPECIES: hypothetical protein [Burkholderia]MBY4728346.1 hypothetical protein [Burkholderia contaminans]MCI3970573.1 hypothetical protein [Burkholderia sp. HI4860]MDN7792509.1 hypothetical protein [Burkholderia contaminans]OXJ04660.1 hypothetical protein CFB48_07935 [Burkholderia sp. AU33647]
MKYAYFDKNTARVLRLLDTDALNYASLPPESNLLQLSDAEYTAAESGTWYVVGGEMTQTAPVVPAAELLAAAQMAQIAMLTTACSNAITKGFVSSALGAAHTYPASITDQQNLTASVLASIYPGLAAGWTTPFWCADASGAWTYAEHTAPQIQQVGQDGKTAILAALTKKQQLVDAVMAATKVTDVQSVVWS